MGRSVNRRFHRRHFLHGLGVSAAVAPLVPVLSREADAAEGPIKRLILFYSPDGTLDDQWRPSGTQTDFTLSPILEPLAPFQDQIIVVRGLSMTQGGLAGGQHFRGMAGLWSGSRLNSGTEFQGANFTTGWGSGQTIDQAVAAAMDTVGRAFRSLEFGVQSGDPHPRHRMIYAGDSQPIPPEPDPNAMFGRLFADLTVDPAQFERIKSQRLSIIDAVAGELEALRPHYGADDAVKIERHLDAVRGIERRLELEPASCIVPDAPAPIDHDKNDNFPAVGSLMMEMLVDALACDLTRVASIQWSRAASNIRHRWLGHETVHHTLAHQNETVIPGIHRWYAQRFAELLGLLQAVPEPFGTGTLLSNSIVVWGQELSTPSHGLDRQPFVIAGGGAGTLQTGRYLNYTGDGHHRLLVSLGRAMGLDITEFGNLDDGKGPLAELGV